MSEGCTLVLIYGYVLNPIVYKPVLERLLVMIWKEILHSKSSD